MLCLPLSLRHLLTFNTCKAKVKKGNSDYEEHFKHLQEHPEEYEVEEQAEEEDPASE